MAFCVHLYLLVPEWGKGWKERKGGREAEAGTTLAFTSTLLVGARCYQVVRNLGISSLILRSSPNLCLIGISSALD